MKIRDIVKFRASGAIGVVVPTLGMLREDGDGLWSVILDESQSPWS